MSSNFKFDLNNFFQKFIKPRIRLKNLLITFLLIIASVGTVLWQTTISDLFQDYILRKIKSPISISPKKLNFNRKFSESLAHFSVYNKGDETIFDIQIEAILEDIDASFKEIKIEPTEEPDKSYDNSHGGTIINFEVIMLGGIRDKDQKKIIMIKIGKLEPKKSKPFLIRHIKDSKIKNEKSLEISLNIVSYGEEPSPIISIPKSKLDQSTKKSTSN